MPLSSKKTKKPRFAKPTHPKAKISFRKNFLPPLLGVLMFGAVFGSLNTGWIVAQYHYHLSNPVAVNVGDEKTKPNPEAPAQIHIPDINLTAPIVTDEKSYDQGKVQLALQKGVVQYGSSADPGHKGNTVILGHSSGAAWAPGNYKFVFTHLEKLEKNDRIFVDFKGTRYIYRVSDIGIVTPTDLSVLRSSGEPKLTLITCTPVGTSKNRLIITARQIVPDPKTAAEFDPDKVKPVTTTVIPN